MLLLFFFAGSAVSAQSLLSFENNRPPSIEMLIEAREVFEYEVSYGFLTLGWIDVELLPDTTYNGENVFHMRTVMRSNNRIPFMGTRIVHYENLFQFTDEWLYSFEFWRNDVHDGEYERVKVYFDREQEKVFFYERGEPTDTLALAEPASGGDIIFYYSRLFAGEQEPYTLPVYIEGEKGSVTSVSSPDVDMRKYKAFEDPIPTYMSQGDANIDGPFGFRGRFKSWFATDDLRVPVEAHVRVIFGNVKVRLISYEQKGPG